MDVLFMCLLGRSRTHPQPLTRGEAGIESVYLDVRYKEHTLAACSNTVCYQQKENGAYKVCTLQAPFFSLYPFSPHSLGRRAEEGLKAKK